MKFHILTERLFTKTSAISYDKCTLQDWFARNHHFVFDIIHSVAISFKVYLSILHE